MSDIRWYAVESGGSAKMVDAATPQEAALKSGATSGVLGIYEAVYVGLYSVDTMRVAKKVGDSTQLRLPFGQL